jgi:hypothetical protein
VASKYSVQQNAGSVSVLSATGFTNYLGCTSLSAYSIAAGDIFAVSQRIEGYNIADLAYGTANAKTVTVSAWVYSSLTGTFGGSLLGFTGSRSYPFTYSIPIANTWTQISVTIPGDTTTALYSTTNGIGLQLNFGLGAGATYSGTAGAWNGSGSYSATGAVSVVGTSGATFYITGVQLEVGSQATSFDFRSYPTEFAMCQRYLFAINAVGFGDIGIGTSTTASGGAIVVAFPVTPRTPPTGISVTSVGNFTITTAAVAAATTSIVFGDSGVNAGRLNVDSASTSFTGSQPLILYSQNTARILFTGSEL